MHLPYRPAVALSNHSRAWPCATTQHAPSWHMMSQYRGLNERTYVLQQVDWQLVTHGTNTCQFFTPSTLNILRSGGAVDRSSSMETTSSKQVQRWSQQGSRFEIIYTCWVTHSCLMEACGYVHCCMYAVHSAGTRRHTNCSKGRKRSISPPACWHVLTCPCKKQSSRLLTN